MAWEIDKNIGHGRFGVVFSCRADDDPADDYPFAMKRLQKSWATTEQAVRRFNREIAILNGLDHENVMSVVDSGDKRGVPWFVMPRADGDLRTAITDGRSADENWTVEVFRRVLRGMAHAHRKNVLHRDLKPGNVLLFGDEPRVSDFGIAKQVDLDGTTLTTTAQELGTLRYMAPEQLADAKKARSPADVYSLGKILAYMLTGNQPEVGRVDLADVPERFRFFIDKCCRENPQQRYQTAHDALAEFEALLAPPEMALPPIEKARELIDRTRAALGTDDEAGALDALEAHFRAYPNEDDMYERVLPQMGRPVLREWLKHSLDGARDVLATYDQHIAGSVAFEYADVIADLYDHIFRSTDDIGLQRMVIARLIDTGYMNNRWHVSEVLCELLWSMSSPSQVALAVEAINDNQRAAAWHAQRALTRPLREPIAQALRRAQHASDEGATG